MSYDGIAFCRLNKWGRDFVNGMRYEDTEERIGGFDWETAYRLQKYTASDGKTYTEFLQFYGTTDSSDVFFLALKVQDGSIVMESKWKKQELAEGLGRWSWIGEKPTWLPQGRKYIKFCELTEFAKKVVAREYMRKEEIEEYVGPVPYKPRYLSRYTDWETGMVYEEFVQMEIVTEECEIYFLALRAPDGTVYDKLRWSEEQIQKILDQSRYQGLISRRTR